MRLFIQPTEALLFRTGHPFNAGENNYAETLFPPTPETLQGAIRATIATHWDPAKTLDEVFQEKDLVELIGDAEQYGRFCITGSALGRRSAVARTGEAVERLFPIPAHLWREEDGARRQVRLKPQATNIITNLPDDMQLLYPDKSLDSRAEAMKGWLTERGLRVALREQEDIAAGELVDSNDIYVHEARVGIGINNATKTTIEGMLYQVRMIRMNSDLGANFVYGFVVDVRLLEPAHLGTDSVRQFVADEQTQNLLRLPDQGWLLLGGERRAAHFEIIAPSTDAQQDSIEQVQNGNLLYFATPAAFARGWQPAAWPVSLSRPSAVAIERYQPIGGWQLTPGSSGGRNKIMRRCVPAGSVYFFNSSIQITQPLTDYGWQIGYGIVYAGEW